MKPKTKRTKTDVADAMAWAALYPLIKFRIRYPSIVRTMAARLSKRTRTTIQRQQVEAWLHPVTKKRVQPKLGVGLLLLEEGERALRERVIVNAKKISTNGHKLRMKARKARK